MVDLRNLNAAIALEAPSHCCVVQAAVQIGGFGAWK